MAKNQSNAQTTEVVETVATFDFAGKFTELQSKKSAMIRHMASLPEFKKADGTADRGKIVKAFTENGQKMIYQHVRNVLVTPTKK